MNSTDQISFLIEIKLKWNSKYLNWKQNLGKTKTKFVCEGGGVHRALG